MRDRSRAEASRQFLQQAGLLGPLLAWMVLMGLLSGRLGSQVSMHHGLSWLGWHTSASLSEFSGLALRKLLHLGEYAVLALLARRWFRSLPASRRWSWLAALGLAAVYAVSDEFHQAFVPERTSSAWDVGIDIVGASLALGMTSYVSARRHLASRALDLVGASVGLILSAPLLLLAALAIRLTMGAPVFFRQRRIGLHARPFTMLKLRTMREASGLPGPQRLTRVGRLLRALSLDEIPQLWNVLKGEMALVGPRPLYAEYLAYYTPRERTRHLVRPGLTGLAQVHGRNRLPWDERLELDAQYVTRKSLILDLILLFRTVLMVLRRRDVREAALQGSLVAYRSPGIRD